MEQKIHVEGEMQCFVFTGSLSTCGQNRDLNG
jgi:hypothetical protein